MKMRFITTVLGIPVLLYIIWQGGLILNLAALIITIIGLFEFYNAFHNKKIYPINWIGYVATLLYYIGIFNELSMVYFSFVLFVMLFASLMVHLFSSKERLYSLAVTWFGLLYVTFSLSHILMLNKVDNNFFIWYVFIIAWGSDTFAYLVGKWIGKRKLTDISPNKTVEGSLGGVIGAVLLSYIYAFIFKVDFAMIAIFLGLFGSVISQSGDLIASKIKRIVGIKDFGNLFPGHGGVMDRFDSIILSAPVVYYFVQLYFLLQ